MTVLFERKAVAYVNDVKVEKLRMAFKVERSLKKDPNTCELSIYQVAPQTLARMQTRHATVVLAAGFANSLSQVFKGTASSVLPQKEGPSWVTKVVCNDGGVSYGFGRGNQSFAPGSSVSDVGAGLAKQMGVGLGNLKQAFAKGGVKKGFDSFVHGFTATGDTQTDLDHLIRSAGFTWSIQDGELQLLTDESNTVGVAEEISPSTGLIGSPEMGSAERKHGPAFLKFKCLLRPQLKPGSAVVVKSRSVSGQFRCEKVGHEGDTMSGGWATTVEARAL